MSGRRKLSSALFLVLLRLSMSRYYWPTYSIYCWSGVNVIMRTLPWSHVILLQVWSSCKTASTLILLFALWSCYRALVNEDNRSQRMTDVKLTDDSNGSDVSLHVGQTFTVALPETPTTGYRWIFAKNGSPICSLLGDSFQPRTHLLGSPGLHEWHFRVDAAGTATVEMRLTRKWDSNDSMRSLLLHLHVTSRACP